MELSIALLLVLAGLALLTVGGEALVRGATAIAQLAGLPTAVIGLTIVAMGTSLPELVVSVLAGVEGRADIAVGNVVGSNLFNVAAALGLTALVMPLPVHGNAVKLEWPFMFLASFQCLLLARDGTLDRLEGGFFVAALVLFVGYTVRLGRTEVGPAERAALADQVGGHGLASAARRPGRPRRKRVLLACGALAVGVVLLVAGGHLLVDGAVRLARLAGMSERVIGLTVVAAGTGAPELVTSLVAALRGRADIAVANMIGSNIFNVLGILGVSALVQPLTVSPQLATHDMWWMLGTALLLLPIIRSGAHITRGEGGVLLGTYVVYLGIVLTQG
jgi:cation:H+ antiporter